MNTATILAVSLLVLQASPSEAPLGRYEFAEPHMGTMFRITLHAPSAPVANKAAQAAFARIAALDDMMTDYKPTSELMRLCDRAGGPPVHVSKELFFVLSESIKVSRLSDGAFDVTVGPLVRLWRRARRTQLLPPADQLASARALVDYRYLHLDEKNQTVQLAKPGMRLDLGGIAKGYAADEALLALKQRSVSRALVAAGGDIAVTDPPPNTLGWKIGIAPLEDPTARPTQFVYLQNAAVSTSGDANQHVEIDGKRYSHIVDPHTGIGLVGRQSVTVVAPRGILADSLTKVVCVMGAEKGLAIVGTFPGVAASATWETKAGMKSAATKNFAGFTEPVKRERQR